MKRLLSLVLFLILTCGCAMAGGPYIRMPEVVVARTGKPVSISYRKSKDSPAGSMTLRDAGGNVLAEAETAAGASRGKITLPAGIVPDHGQTVTVWFHHDSMTELQGELLLAVDDRSSGIYRVQTGEKRIAITFDSTGRGAKADKLLDLLDRYDVKCTFFFQGSGLEENPEYAVRVSKHGHEMANHSMYHPDMREINDEKILREIRNCNDIIRDTTGQTVRFYRPPAGYYTYRDLAISRALGCEMILWTFDSKDGGFGLPLNTILGRLRQNSEPGAIILMHDYGEWTVQALETYIPDMQAQGYEFVTVGELLKYRQ